MNDPLPPYVPARTAPPRIPPAPGTATTAVVERVLPDSRYVVNVRGQLLEVALPYLLAPGDTLLLHVRNAGPAALQLDVAPAATASSPVIADARIEELADRLQLPRRPETSVLIREFLRQQAPIERETISAALDSTRGDPDRMRAAAFLAAHGIEPQEEPVRLLARIQAPAGPLESAPTNPLLQILARSGETDLRNLLGTSQTRALDAALRGALDAHPQLRSIDRAIAFLDRSIPIRDSVPSTLAAARRVADLLQAILRGEVPDEPLSESAEVLRELRSRLLEMERREMESDPVLSEARSGKGALLDSFERAQGFRLASQLHSLHGEGTAAFELVMKGKDHRSTIPVRIRRRRGRTGGAEDDSTLFVLDADFTRMGRVRTHIEARGKFLMLGMSVADEDIREHLARGSSELIEALRTSGFESTLRVQAETIRKDPLFFPDSGGPEYTVVDVKA